MRSITSVADAVTAQGETLGVSEWLTVDQSRIDDFADVTDDHQWIHIDTERAAAESPYGATIAHGFLTLSLIPSLSKDNYQIVNRKMGINYGLNRVRFLSPVTPGSRIRVRSELVEVDAVDELTVNLTVRHTVELDGADKPALVADLISRNIFHS